MAKLAVINRDITEALESFLNPTKKQMQYFLNQYVTATVDLAALLDYKPFVINKSSVGTQELVKEKSGYVVKVFVLMLTVNGDVDVTFKSGSAEISGNMHFESEADGFAMAVQPPAYIMQGDVGEDFKIYLHAAVDVDGFGMAWREKARKEKA
jgi:hypothetical protein